MPNLEDAIKDVDTKEKIPKTINDKNKKKIIYLNFSTNHILNYHKNFYFS